MAIIAKYTFDKSNYIDLLPTFNEEFVGYTIEDSVVDNTVTRIINHDTLLPTKISFEQGDSVSATANRLCLLSVEYLELSEVTSIYAMFRNCQALTSVDCTDWNTSKVTNMESMFGYCYGLQEVNINNIDVSNVTNMKYMFNACSSIKTLDLNNWNTSKLENISFMFHNCGSLENLLISNWNTSSLKYFNAVMSGNDSLKELDLTNWNVEKGTETVFFNDLNKLEVLKVKNMPLDTVMLLAENITYGDNNQQLRVEANVAFMPFLQSNSKYIFVGEPGEQIAPKEKSNYFGIFEEMEQFYAHGLPEVEGYFVILETVYFYDGKFINKVIDNKFVGKYDSLEQVVNEGFCELYGDLYYREANGKIARLRGVKYGDTYYHTLTLDSWQKICECINLLKNANDGTLDDSLEDSTHTFTSLLLDEKFKELIQYCKDAVIEAGKKKITASYVDNCPTNSKMIENKMYIVPVYKNEHEIDYYERYIKINDVKYYLGEWGHSAENFYTKEAADGRYEKTSTISSEMSLGLTSDSIYKVFNGKTRVNKKIVSTTAKVNEEPKIVEIDDDNFVGKIKTRIINGFQEVLFEVTSKGGTHTYANTDAMHGATITYAETIFNVPSLKEASSLEGDAFIKGYMKVKDFPEEEVEEGVEAMKPFKYGVCFINGNDLHIVADLNKADVTYSGYFLYPVWGNEVNR